MHLLIAVYSKYVIRWAVWAVRHAIALHWRMVNQQTKQNSESQNNEIWKPLMTRIKIARNNKRGDKHKDGIGI